MFNFKKYNYKFSIESLSIYKTKFRHKICYKPAYKFLLFKSSTSQAISCRLFKDGKYLKMYKNCKKFYLKYFIYHMKTINLGNNLFLEAFENYQMLRDFDRALF
jgi:hypothetical protein